MKQFSVVIAGLGPRGFNTYAQYQKLHPDKMKVVAIADIDKKRLDMAASDLGICPECCFSSAEEMFSQPKLADLAVIATQDAQHVAHACAALNKGYHLLLEKPIATTLDDCKAIEQLAIKNKRLVAVCHVLRYTAFYRKIKEILDSGAIGEIVTVNALENVGYWHQSHSFVRGNWRNSKQSSPMILAKSCHDLDILNFIIGKKCVSLSSYGSLKFFKKENQPKDATKFCLDCPRQDSCKYSAKNIYLSKDSLLAHEWLCYVVSPDLSREGIERNLRTGDYGRCVFDCDNDVVDHQVVNMQYADDVTCSFTMTAFSNNSYRTIRIMCTQGEIEASQEDNIIRVTSFGEKPIFYDINKLAADLSGHGGGDNQMMTDFLELLDSNKGDLSSSITSSMQSHIMAFMAEESRLENGKSIKL